MFRRLRGRAERRRLMKGRPQFSVVFTRSQVAASLWSYGEDDLAERALAMSDTDLRKVRAIAAHYEDPQYPLPVAARRVTHNHVNACAAVTYFEGRLRPLARERRRPESSRPERFTPVNPDVAEG